MKNFIATILIGLFISNSSFLVAQNAWMGLQDKIEGAMMSSFECESSTALDSLMETINGLENSGPTHWKEYWKSYSLYHSAIYEAYGSKDVEKAKTITKDAIQILSDLENKNSEDYALLAYLQSFSLQWVSGMAIIKESGKAEEWGSIALEMDPENPRAYYVAGSYDYHKPAFVGGGKKAVDLLEKSLNKYQEWIPNPMLPSWGEEGTFAKLVQAHIKKENKDNAMTVLEEGLAKFPESKDLMKLKDKLKS